MDREALRNLAAKRRNEAAPVQTVRKIKWNCSHCDHDFVSERVFMNHRCKERERFEELKTPVGLAAYSYYSEWLRLKKRGAQPVENFAASSSYTTFIKFAQHVMRVNMPNPMGFIRTMIDNGDVQPSLWCRDNVYALYLNSYDAVVPPIEQFLASLDLIKQLAEEFEVPVDQVYGELGVQKILLMVQRRKLSAWFLVASKKFHAFMKQQDPVDQDRLEAGIQVGAMMMRIQQNAESTKNFGFFCQAARDEGL